MNVKCKKGYHVFPQQGGLEGSVLTYDCGPGKYPFPVRYRICGADGDWSPMRLANGRPASRATCKGNWILFSCFSCFLHSLLFSSPSILFFCPSISLPFPDVLCPAQLQLDNGDFWPRDQWFRVGTTQSFSCQHGFTLYGSAERNCTLSGEWTGTTPVCDNHGEKRSYKTCSYI